MRQWIRSTLVKRQKKKLNVSTQEVNGPFTELFLPATTEDLLFPQRHRLHNKADRVKTLLRFTTDVVVTRLREVVSVDKKDSPCRTCWSAVAFNENIELLS